MNRRRLGPFLASAFLGACGLCAAQTQPEAPPPKQIGASSQEPPLKLLKSTPAPYPEEAQKKNIEGKVVLRIVVDANGHVTSADALSGPPELFPAAIATAAQVLFVPPAHAPVLATVEVSYGFPKPCPGPISDYGEVMSGGRLLNKEGKVVGVPASDDYSLPPFFDEDRKAGAAGDMVLSITLDAAGRVKKIHVVKSVSSRLDRAAIDTVRKCKFKRIDGVLAASHDALELHIRYQATCNVQF